MSKSIILEYIKPVDTPAILCNTVFPRLSAVVADTPYDKIFCKASSEMFASSIILLHGVLPKTFLSDNRSFRTGKLIAAILSNVSEISSKISDAA